jgi:hypothetical protein
MLPRTEQAVEPSHGADPGVGQRRAPVDGTLTPAVRASGGLGRHVLRDHFERAVELVRRAELHDLGAGVQHRGVASGCVAKHTA